MKMSESAEEESVGKFQKYLAETGDIDGAMVILTESLREDFNKDSSNSPNLTERQKKALASAVEKIEGCVTVEDVMSLITASIKVEQKADLERERRALLRKLGYR